MADSMLSRRFSELLGVVLFGVLVLVPSIRRARDAGDPLAHVMIDRAVEALGAAIA